MVATAYTVFYYYGPIFINNRDERQNRKSVTLSIQKPKANIGGLRISNPDFRFFTPKIAIFRYFFQFFLLVYEVIK